MQLTIGILAWMKTVPTKKKELIVVPDFLFADRIYLMGEVYVQSRMNSCRLIQ